jgi:hypothetical protein
MPCLFAWLRLLGSPEVLLDEGDPLAAEAYLAEAAKSA